MCGFVGYIKENKVKNCKIIENMANRIKHRGPDQVGLYEDDMISMAFRRLSIIDLKYGGQPLYNESKNLVLTFNGEIYNYEDIKKDLIKKHHIFKTNTDSEVLIHGYEEYGSKILEKLRGMFAFVIWDNEKKELFAARDNFGIKPFYYYHNEDVFMYSSEIKAFLDNPYFKKELNIKQLESYLSFQFSPLRDTFFNNVYKLMPGEYLIYKNGKLKTNKYFNLAFNINNNLSLNTLVDNIDCVMKDSIKHHKISDVEVGTFLSSGIDSSFITASSNVDKTFTVGFDRGEKYNEINYAKELSDMLNITNISKVISDKEFFSEFPKIQYYLDEPLADASCVALYFLCKEARKHVKVVLSGEGADEFFGGYNIYKEPLDTKIYDYIPFPIRKTIGSVASLFGEKKGINFLVRKSKSLEEKFIGNAYIFSEKEIKKLLCKDKITSAISLVKPYYQKVQQLDEVSKMQYIDENFWLVGDILLKADKMSMANSLEVRVPFLDKEVYNLSKTIPTNLKIKDRTTKYAFRKCASRVLPDKWSSKKKLGFPVPIREWIKEEKYFNLIKDTFTSDYSKNFFDISILNRLLDEHKIGKKDNSRKIWTVYSFLVWYNEYFIKEV